jgi:hypothetical protein
MTCSRGSSTAAHARAVRLLALLPSLLLGTFACGLSTNSIVHVPTAIPTSPLGCAGLLDTVQPASAGTAFPDVPFPAQAISTAPRVQSSGDGQYTVSTLAVCVPNTSPNQIQTFAARNFVAAGWNTASTVPVDGVFLQKCPTVCWMRGDPLHLRYIQLAHANAHADRSGTASTYSLLLYSGPPPSLCPEADFPSNLVNYGSPPGTTGLAFPTLSYYVRTHSAQLPNWQTFVVCSPGTPASILKSMKFWFSVYSQDFAWHVSQSGPEYLEVSQACFEDQEPGKVMIQVGTYASP